MRLVPFSSFFFSLRRVLSSESRCLAPGDRTSAFVSLPALSFSLSASFFRRDRRGACGISARGVEAEEGGPFLGLLAADCLFFCVSFYFVFFFLFARPIARRSGSRLLRHRERDARESNSNGSEFAKSSGAFVIFSGISH